VIDAAHAVRAARPGDAEAIAAAWLDAGRYYAAFDPRRFQVPSEPGLIDWFAGMLAEPRKENEVWLVAESDGRVVGDLTASLSAPIADVRFQMMRDVGEVVLRIESLAVRDGDRRRGAGTALMRAAEAWGRERGATVVFLTTDRRSPLSVPFYEHLGLEPVSLGFWKHL
jgi:GNAT superfamily N-acetyltransferase